MNPKVVLEDQNEKLWKPNSEHQEHNEFWINLTFPNIKRKCSYEIIEGESKKHRDTY